MPLAREVSFMTLPLWLFAALQKAKQPACQLLVSGLFPYQFKKLRL
jgi:hypothetical protein